MVHSIINYLFLFFFVTMTSSTIAYSAELTGAGASFPAPLYDKWANEFEKISHIQINYQSIGSGGGIKQIKAKTVNFGATDIPLNSQELDALGLVQFPTVIGGIVPIINIEGIPPGKLKLTGDLLAQIYLGTITYWDDEKIKKINPSLNLPNLLITVVHRADSSGTTFLFTNYLSAVSETWKNKLGTHANLAWPVGIGGKGNEGISSYVQRIKGAIGYVESAYAMQNKLIYTSLQNKEGVFTTPTISSFKEAAIAANWNTISHLNSLLINQKGKNTWPITGASYILIYKKQENAETGKQVLQFFSWSYKNGRKIADDLHYVPISPSIVQLIETSWSKNIKNESGKTLWP